MRRFARMFERLDRTTSTNAKVAAMASYFREAPAEDAAWALYFLTGRRLKRLVNWRQLWEWSKAQTRLEDWLLGECYSVVGDGAETISLLVDRGEGLRERDARATGTDVALHEWVEGRLLRLSVLEPREQQAAILGWWDELTGTELLLFNKLVTGEFRVGVSQRLVIRALAEVAGVEEAIAAHRLSGEWRPTAEWFGQVVSGAGVEDGAAAASRLYPFFLASPLLDVDPGRGPEALGDRREWLVEYKWDGIRAQLIRRGGRVYLWSRGEELVTDRFPEIRDAAYRLADGTVLDGEIMAYREGPLKFSVLQRRIGRQALTPAILRQAPAAFIAFDVLEQGGEDIRELPLSERRARLEAVLAGGPGRLVLSEELTAATWGELAANRGRSRELSVEGLMIKRRSSPYQVGRRRGDWWKWKVDPFSIDAVLVYAQPGHGRRANLLTDYTFAVWDKGGQGDEAGVFAELDARREPELVPVAKAYSGLSDVEIAELDRWIRQHTVERFGPVRAVEPVQVFELHFEGLARSTRHRSGIAVRFPRIARWRRDKRAADADTLQRVKELMDGDGSHTP
jgi:DNA ligase 1